MIRISRQADYSILLLSHLAKGRSGMVCTARDLSAASNVPVPMVAKVLKLLGRAGLLTSHRGATGGYGLARSPSAITVGQIIQAVDGPIALTECAETPLGGSDCHQEQFCPVRGSWHRLNESIREALDRVTLAEMTCPVGDPVGAFVGH